VTDDEIRRVVRRGWVQARVQARSLGAHRHPLPHFVVIGAQRSGTTSLYHHLADHPRVRPPLRKEIQFLTLRWDRGLPWYRRHFPALEHAGLQTFEASPYYLCYPLAPVRAAAALPETRFVALLREPVARATSHYLHNRATGVESLPFERALDLEPARLAGDAYGRNHRLFSYITRGLYAEQIRRWRDMVGDQLLVVLSEDLFAEPARTFAHILDFLGLDRWEPAQFTAHGPRRGPADPLPEGVRRRLQERFAAPNRELADLLGRDLSPWTDGMDTRDRSPVRRSDGPADRRPDGPPASPAVHVRESGVGTSRSRT
jgi:hypothetical protein